MSIKDLNPLDPFLVGHMVTYTGQFINLFDIDPEKIVLEDIAHGLAYNCRWNGHTKDFYSIAEHCIQASDKAPDEIKLLTLFHDAEEAYWGDMIRPLKMMLKTHYPALIDAMKRTRLAIFEKFGIEDGEGYKEFDGAELVWEFDNLIVDLNHKPMTPHVANSEWLMRAQWLLENPKYYYLKEGDIIQEGDECEVSNNWNDPEKWVDAGPTVGQRAPNPNYIAHRKYRRKISA